MDKRENDAIKVLIERYKKKTSEGWRPPFERDAYNVVALDLIEFLDDSAKIEQIDV